MLRRFRPYTALALALATLATACGSDSSTAPSSQAVTLEQALAELSSPVLSDATAAFLPGTPALPALALSRCTYQASTQSFACTPVVSSGLTVTQSFTLLDGSGAPQSAFDKGSTSAVRANTVVAGTLQDGPDQVTVDGQQELTLSGLRTATHTLDGTSTMHLASADSGFTSEITVNTTIAGLKLPPLTADGARAWPAAGTITTEISESFGGDTPDVLQIKITFNGTSKVTVTMTVPGSGAATCTIDLASSAPSCQ